MIQKTTLALVASLFFQSSYCLAMDIPNTSTVSPQGFTQTIAFYNSHEPFYEFTNFYQAPFIENFDQGRSNIWTTSEHYFQGHKFNHPGARHILEQIKTASAPRDAFNLARKYQSQIRTDWHGVPGMDERQIKKVQVMYAGLKMKFTSHIELAALLMSTDGCHLVENAGKNDDYWGNGADGKGKNMLGQLLMELREELFQNPSLIHGQSPLVTSFNLPTIQQLSGNHGDYYKHILNQLRAHQPVARHSQIFPTYGGHFASSSMTSPSSVKANRQYAGPEQQGGFRERISTSLIQRFQGLSSCPPIDISFNKHMLMTTTSSQEAQDIVQSLKNDFGMHGVNVDFNDPKKVFIRRDVIDQFLDHVLGFDYRYITAFKTNFKV